MPGLNPVVIDPPNSRQGDKPRAAFNKVNTMFAELYARLAYAEANLGAKSLDELGDVVISAPAVRHVLQFDGEKWLNDFLPLGLYDLTDVEIADAQDNDILRFSSGAWRNVPLAELTDLNSLSDVAIDVGLQAGHVLQFNGTAWVNSALSLAQALDDLTDVQLANLEAAQFLRFDGTKWINETVSFVSALASLTDVQLGTPDDYQVLGFFDGKWTNLNAPGLTNPGARILDELDDVVIDSPAAGQVLRYTGTAWENDQMIVPVDQSTTLNTSQFTDSLDLDNLVNNRPIVTAQVKFTGITAGQARLVDKATGAVLQTVDINAGGFTILAYNSLFAAKAQTTGNITTRFTATLLNAS